MMPPAGAAPLQQEPALLVHAYLDGELDLANALAVKQQIEEGTLTIRKMTPRTGTGSSEVADQCCPRADFAMGLPSDMAGLGGLGPARRCGLERFDMAGGTRPDGRSGRRGGRRRRSLAGTDGFEADRSDLFRAAYGETMVQRSHLAGAACC